MKEDNEYNTLLIVDDEVNILKLLEKIFKALGYQVFIADNVEKAFEILERNDVQVIISDQKMPDMTGIDFFRKVKIQNPDSVRVILSGEASLVDILDAINKGEVYRYLTKPWQTESLISTISQCYEYYQKSKENKLLLEKIVNKNESLKELNKVLEEKVNERIKSIKLAIQILEKLPKPFIAFDSIGRNIFMNNIFKDSFVNIEVGKNYLEIFPNSISEKIKNILENKDKMNSFVGEFFGRKVKVLLKVIDKKNIVKGFFIIFNII